MDRLKKFSICLFLVASSFLMMMGCSAEIDPDGSRAGAIEIKLDQVVSDELYPTAGDSIDWKMVFVPSAGDIIVNTFWDSPNEIFNVVIGIYDRFGIPIKEDKRNSGAGGSPLRAFTPESGLHYIKVAAASGKSIYSINVQFEYNEDGFVAPDTAPTFDAYLDFESEMEANSKRASAGGGGGGAAGGGGGGAAGGGGGGGAAGGGGGAVLPTAVGGGVVLPSAAAGGISSSAASSGPTIIREPSGGGGGGGSRVSSSEVKVMNQKGSAVTTEKSALKPICPDIKGSFTAIEADIMSISGKKKGAQIKLSVGQKDGVNEGAVGDIYVDGKILEGGRFKVTKILPTSCIAETNASAADVKKASKFVVKSPN